MTALATRTHTAARFTFLISLSALGGAFFLLAWGGIALAQDAGRVSALWLPNAMLVAVLLRTDRRLAWLRVGVCLGANMLANFASGDDLPLGAGLALCNALEVIAIIGGIRYLSVSQLDIMRPESLLAFAAVAGLAVPVLTATLATLLLAATGHATDAGVWTTYAKAHALGSVVVTPVLLILTDAWTHRRTLTRMKAIEAAAIIGGVACICILVFTQSRFPLLFVITPFILLAAFRLGAPGAACAIVVVAVVSGLGTAAGTGPIALVVGGIGDKLTMLQLFLASSFAAALPVAAVLEQRERLTAALRRSDQMLASITDNIRDVVFRADGRGRWSFLNPGWEQLTGTTIADGIGRPVTELIVPEDVDAARAEFMSLFAGQGVELQAQFRFRHSSGETRWAETTIRRQEDEDGHVLGTIGSIRDITDRQRQTMALAAREHELSVLTAHSADMIVRTGFDNVRRYVSPASRTLLGYEPEELVGRPPLSGVHPDDREAVAAVHQRMLDGADTGTLIHRKRHRDGRYIWVEANYRLVRDEATGEPTEFVSVVRDFEARKQLEDALRDARDRAEDAARVTAGFLANMSHEIRTPMNGVIGFTELLLDGDLDPEQRRHAQLIDESGRAMMTLLNDILDLSRIDANQVEIAHEPYDLPHAIAASARIVSGNAAAKGLTLDLLIDEDVPKLAVGDGQRLRQILLNLLSNAIKFTDRGYVRLSARVVDDMIEIMAEDSGCGIAPDRQDAIFEQFVQADASIARRYGGSGLGLAISLRLARLMGGDLRLDRSDGTGTRMGLTLPLVRAAADAVPAASAAAPPRPDEPSRRVRVLVAEDAEINRLLVEALLVRHGHDVTVAVNGAEAIAAFQQAEAGGRGFDMILMDMQMPQVDGLEATRRLRALSARGRSIPIVALTANAFSTDIEACRAAGMDAHLAKPFEIAALLGMVARFTRVAAADLPPPSRDPVIAAMRGRYDELKSIYRDELDTLRDAIVQAHADPALRTRLAAICHKLAGSAGMFGETALGDLAHAIEREAEAGSATHLAARASTLADALKLAA